MFCKSFGIKVSKNPVVVFSHDLKKENEKIPFFHKPYTWISAVRVSVLMRNFSTVRTLFYLVEWSKASCLNRTSSTMVFYSK